jgi:hypothetical protein
MLAVVLSLLFGVAAPPAQAGTTWTRTPAATSYAYSWNNYKVTVGPKAATGFVYPKGYQALPPLLTVKRGSVTVAADKPTVALSPGVYSAYSTYRYRSVTRKWVPTQYTTIPARTETKTYPLDEFNTAGCWVSNFGAPEVSLSSWQKYTNLPTSTVDWTQRDSVSWNIRFPALLNCPAQDGSGGTWTVRAVAQAPYDTVSAYVGINCTTINDLPCITREQHAALRPANPTTTQTVTYPDYTVEYRTNSNYSWSTTPPPGLSERPELMQPSSGRQGAYTGTYTKTVTIPARTVVSKPGYWQTVYGPVISRGFVRTVSIVKVANYSTVTRTEFNAVRDGDSLTRVRSIFGSAGKLVYSDPDFLGYLYEWRTNTGGWAYVWFGGYGEGPGANVRSFFG